MSISQTQYNSDKMNKDQLQQIIKEELQSVLNEYSSNNFKFDAQKSGYGNPINPSLLAKLLPKSAQTTKEAEERLKSFEGGNMFMHSQVHYVKPNGNRPDRPLLYFGQTQYWLHSPKNVNVTFLLIEDVTEDGTQYKSPSERKAKQLGWAYVSTDVFLKEMQTMYEVVKKSS